MGFLVGAVPILVVLAGIGIQFGGPLAVLTGRRMVALVGHRAIRAGYWLWLGVLGAAPVVSWTLGVGAVAAAIWHGRVAFGAGMLTPLVLAVALFPWLLAVYLFLWTADPAPDS